jgi:hypothetical protein
MNRNQLRLVAGFLAVFIVISVAPLLPAMPALAVAPFSIAGLRIDVTAPLADGVAELLLTCAAGMVAAVTIIAVRRRVLAGRSPARGTRPGVALARARATGERAVVVRESALTLQLRKEAERGVRVPELARTYGLSQDAVRGALGRRVSPPAAQGGSSFRGRKAVTPAKPAARAVVPRRSSYQALA